jgi:hypothetical protein
MNEGVMKPLNIILPRGTMLSPEYPAAVIAGNVETSQAVTSALFLALGVMAAAQSTMNNTTWGNAKYQYYETICGGTGAGVLNDGTGHHGTPAVHSHMTNSRLTDPEVLEWRFPVMLEQFAIRHGTGGKGKFHGGDGPARCLGPHPHPARRRHSRGASLRRQARCRAGRYLAPGDPRGRRLPAARSIGADSMTLVFYAGIAITLAGLAGILWFIQRARRLRQSQADDITVQAELRALVLLNVAAVGLAFIGLAITVVGLILAP